MSDSVFTIVISTLIAVVLVIFATLIYSCTSEDRSAKTQCYEANKHRQAAEVILMCGKIDQSGFKQ